jgi:hypothetical protein
MKPFVEVARRSLTVVALLGAFGVLLLPSAGAKDCLCCDFEGVDTVEVECALDSSDGPCEECPGGCPGCACGTARLVAVLASAREAVALAAVRSLILPDPPLPPPPPDPSSVERPPRSKAVA